MTGKINVFLSDIHISVNTPTCWYQKDVHQKYLKSILKYVQRNGEKINDFVILGDWFDLWTYLPEAQQPSLADVFKENKEIFTPSDDKADFISCLDSIHGHFRYVNGNHDLRVRCKDINDHFQPLSTKGRQVICEDSHDQNTKYRNGGIYAEHGHLYSLFNHPDNNKDNIFSPLPLGFYITRTVSLLCKHKLNKEDKANSAELADSGNPTFSIEASLYDMAYMLLLLHGKQTLAQAILFDLVNRAGEKDPEKILYKMFDGQSPTSINAAKAAGMFSYLSIKDTKALEVDFNNSVTTPATALLDEGHKVVLMGHTHVPKITTRLVKTNHTFQGAVYANTGFVCADKPGMESQKIFPTFVEVEEKNDGKYVVRLQKVNYPDGSISTLDSKSTW